MENDELLSFKEVEAILKRGRIYVYALRKLGLPVHGGRVWKSDLLKFIDTHPAPRAELKRLGNNGEQNGTLGN